MAGKIQAFEKAQQYGTWDERLQELIDKACESGDIAENLQTELETLRSQLATQQFSFLDGRKQDIEFIERLLGSLGTEKITKESLKIKVTKIKKDLKAKSRKNNIIGVSGLALTTTLVGLFGYFVPVEIGQTKAFMPHVERLNTPQLITSSESILMYTKLSPSDKAEAIKVTNNRGANQESINKGIRTLFINSRFSQERLQKYSDLTQIIANWQKENNLEPIPTLNQGNKKEDIAIELESILSKENSSDFYKTIIQLTGSPRWEFIIGSASDEQNQNLISKIKATGKFNCEIINGKLIVTLLSRPLSNQQP